MYLRVVCHKICNDETLCPKFAHGIQEISYEIFSYPSRQIDFPKTSRFGSNVQMISSNVAYISLNHSSFFYHKPMASSCKKSKSIRISPYNLPLTIVRNQEEDESFIEMHHDILNDCNVRLELS